MLGSLKDVIVTKINTNKVKKPELSFMQNDDLIVLMEASSYDL
jgi:hypothetical protein